MPFKPGDPGGPGRPKQKPFLEWCGKWTVEKAEKYLAPIAEKSNNKNQLEAIKLIMAYGVGKPVDFSQVSHEFEGLATNPVEAKAALDGIIAEGARKGLGECLGSPDSPGDGAAKVPGP